MDASLRFDHAILAVNDLRQAQADFESLGFTVFYGGQHANGLTENCLMVFQDGSYLELIGQVRRPEPPAPDESDSLRRIFDPGEGWAGYALLSRDLVHDSTSMQQRGLYIVGPMENSRLRPDGERVAWRAAILDAEMMPFFLEDVTPRRLRVPDDERCIHPNGVTGVVRIVIAGEALAPMTVLYRTILGQTETPSTLEMPGIHAVDFTLPGTTITLVSPLGEHPELAAHLERRSPCIYAIYLAGGLGRAFEISRTHAGLLYAVR